VADWRISGTYLEFCNCDPGCGCNFRGFPSSPEGNCEAVLTHIIEDGSFDELDLAGTRVSWALWWPGYGLFEIFNSTLDETTAVERATLDITVDGKRSRVVVDGVTENQMAPLTNPVTGDENDVRIVKSTGFIWRDGEIAQSEMFRVDLPEMSWDLAERHAVFSEFDYTNA
jgi:hypothetical protein